MLQKWEISDNNQRVISIGTTPYNEFIDILCAGDPSFGYWECPLTGLNYFTSTAIIANAEDAEFSTDGMVGGQLVNSTDPC